MRYVYEKVFEDFVKASEINTDRAIIFSVGSALDGGIYKLFRVVGAYNWERYDKRYYKSFTKSLMLFKKRLSVVVVSYIEDFSYFVEYVEKDVGGGNDGSRSVKIIKHMENYERVDKLLGYVYVRPDSYIKIADEKEISKLTERLIKEGWKLTMLA